VAAAAAATLPATGAAPGTPAPNPNPGWHFLRAHWGRTLLGEEPGTPGFEVAWNEALRNGFFQGPAPAAAPPRRLAPAALALLGALPEAPAGPELQLYPHLALRDGRSGNNGWLQEFPDPVTRISWGGAVSIAPRRFDEMKLANGDLVEVQAGGATLVAPAYRHAGMHNDQIAIPLGFGRSACGVIGNGIGPNAFALRGFKGGRVVAAGLPVTIRRVGGREALAFAQGSDVIDRDRRPLVPATTLTAFEKDPKAGTEQEKGGPSAWPGQPYPNARWAMVIDLARCNGCGKCVIGCQAENNVPIVGRQGIVDGREMSWMRVDRYYDAPKKDGHWGAEVWDGPLAVVEEPVTLFEPMLCQHCENAPCETVCPFVATTHSEDGLNQQVYNRCVGTRYCANNCPFKVRRFNFWEYSTAKESALFRALDRRLGRHADLNTRGLMPMKNNPEVTVRSRGVMEKCSFCIQRIREARAEATRAGRTKDHFPDGAVVPACVEACPTGAIVFGDVNAPGSRVAALAAHPRAMKLLEATGVKPSISYLTKVRHDKA
jgi:molybdopterin-containing oxidoreductase family iron-sulfur binding subunit